MGKLAIAALAICISALLLPQEKVAARSLQQAPGALPSLPDTSLTQALIPPEILDSADVQATILAPTDEGIQTTATALGLSLPTITSDPLLVTDILTYHILPSTLQVSDLVDGYSFNSELTVSGVPQSILVNGTGTSASFTGSRSSAPISGQLSTTCQIAVIPIGGLLVP